MTNDRAILLSLAALAFIPAAGFGDDFEKFGQKLLRGAAQRIINPEENQPPQRRQHQQHGPGRHAPATATTAHATSAQTKLYSTTTDDGWKLVLHRYWNGAPQAGKLPVVLCHGFSYNGSFYDLRSDVSLANYLASQGFDVWAIDLRGTGLSNKWALPTEGAADALVSRALTGKGKIPPSGFVSLDPKYARWNLDDHVDRDIPAVLRYVTQETGSPQVTWIGHSMGGNIMLAHLSKYGPNPAVGRLVTVGSQVVMPNGQLVVQFLIEMVKQRQAELQGQKIDAKQISDSVNNIFFNELNTDPAIMAALATTGHDQPSLGLIRQYQTLSRTGRLMTVDEKFDYSAGLKNVTCPYLIVGGASDQIAPPGVQKKLYDGVGSADRTLLILGRTSGMSVDYGHSDSLVGQNVAAEVFPKIAAWLNGQK